MKTCGLCSTELKFMNTPIMGAGKTKDDHILCSKCYMKVSPVVNIKKHTLAEIQHLFEKQMMDKNEQKAKAEENKQAAIAEKAAKTEEKKEQKLAEMKAVIDAKEAEKNVKKLRQEEIKATIQNLKLDGSSSFLG